MESIISCLELMLQKTLHHPKGYAVTKHGVSNLSTCVLRQGIIEVLGCRSFTYYSQLEEEG